MTEAAELRVDPSNRDVAAAWNGDDGAHWARHAEAYDRSIRRYHGAFLEAAAIRPGERVLDVGCGNGRTTRDAARLAHPGTVVGLDVSGPLIDSARALAASEGVDNALFVHADAQVHPFEPATFDVAISRNGAMFFGDPPAAFANLARALRPGGRMALLVWQEMARNEWMGAFVSAVVGAPLPPPPAGAPGPFSLGDPDRVRPLLEGAGFTDVRLEPREEPMEYGDTPEEAFAFISSFTFVRGALSALDERRRQEALVALRRSVEEHDTGEGVHFGSAAWIVTAMRAG